MVRGRKISYPGRSNSEEKHGRRAAYKNHTLLRLQPNLAGESVETILVRRNNGVLGCSHHWAWVMSNQRSTDQIGFVEEIRLAFGH
jgi:hypothetical protein